VEASIHPERERKRERKHDRSRSSERLIFARFDNPEADRCASVLQFGRQQDLSADLCASGSDVRDRIDYPRWRRHYRASTSARALCPSLPFITPGETSPVKWRRGEEGGYARTQGALRLRGGAGIPVAHFSATRAINLYYRLSPSPFNDGRRVEEGGGRKRIPPLLQGRYVTSMAWALRRRDKRWGTRPEEGVEREGQRFAMT